MTYTFKRRRGMQACMGAAMAALAAAFIGLGLIFPVRAIGVFAVLFGLAVAFLALSLLLDIFTPDPILSIGPDGVRFVPFSAATVPWREITDVTLSQGYYYGSGGITGRDGKRSFRYTIRDPSHYPQRRGIAALARATAGKSIALNTLTLIDADGEDLLAALRAHYPGAINEIPVPGFPPPP